MHHNLWLKRGAVAVAVLALSSLGGAAIAHSTDDDGSKPRKLATTEGTPELQKQAVNSERSQADIEAKRLRIEARVQKRLDEAKLKACAKVESKILNHASSTVRHTERQLEVFDKAVQKVQKFAADKKITVADEANLLANIKAARDKVVEDLATLKADSEFECDSNNPKGQIEAFKADSKLIRADLKAYRLTVRQFIQAVRQANGQNRSTSDSSATENDSTTTTNPVGGQ